MIKGKALRGLQILQGGVKTEKRVRQARLPEMDDPRIQQLEDAAIDYAEIRDQRQRLTAQEVPLKQRLIGLMKREGKEKYHHQEITITLIHEKESVKVRVKNLADED